MTIKNKITKFLFGYVNHKDCGTKIYTNYCTRCGSTPNQPCNKLRYKDEILKHKQKNLE